MKSYDDLSIAGKLRRLRNLAAKALTHYDIENPRLVYHGFETNLLYRVTTASGERFVLRLATPGWRTLDDLRAEASWLDALSRETSISAPRIVPARSGELVLPMRSPDVPDTWNTSSHDLGSRPAAGTLPDGAQSGKDGGALCQTSLSRSFLDSSDRIHDPAIRALVVEG